jgi:endonuclease YncB( thermonuclease family)
VIRELSPDFSLEGRNGWASLVVFPPTQGARHNGANVALELVKAGLAWAAPDAPEPFQAAQKEARRDRRGEWRLPRRAE